MAVTAVPPHVAVMPRAHPRIAHFTGKGRYGYLVGDALGAIVRAIALLFRWIDVNMQVDADGEIWGIHWGKVGRNGYLWIWTGRLDDRGREIRIRNPHPGKAIADCHSLEVSRLRTAKRGGYRPRTLLEHMARAVRGRRRITIAGEAKGNPHWTPKVWKRLHDQAVVTGCRLVVMTLQDIPGWRRRLDGALDAGFQAALLPRGPRPHDWDDWAARGVAKWGAWR